MERTVRVKEEGRKEGEMDPDWVLIRSGSAAERAFSGIKKHETF